MVDPARHDEHRNVVSQHVSYWTFFVDVHESDARQTCERACVMCHMWCMQQHGARRTACRPKALSCHEATLGPAGWSCFSSMVVSII